MCKSVAVFKVTSFSLIDFDHLVDIPLDCFQTTKQTLRRSGAHNRRTSRCTSRRGEIHTWKTAKRHPFSNVSLALTFPAPGDDDVVELKLATERNDCSIAFVTN